MTELRDLRVPGLGLAPTKNLDEIYPRDYDPLIAAFLRSQRRRSGLSALVARLRTAVQRGLRVGLEARHASRVHDRQGITFGQVAR